MSKYRIVERIANASGDKYYEVEHRFLGMWLLAAWGIFPTLEIAKAHIRNYELAEQTEKMVVWP